MKTRQSHRKVVGGMLLALVVPGVAMAEHPQGWGGGGPGYEFSTDEAVKHQGKASGSVKAVGEPENGFGTLTQGIRADKYRGKRVRLTAFVKSAIVDGWAGLWMRVDGKEKTGIAFDNMMNRAIKGDTDWKACTVVLDVPESAEQIFFGFLLAGKGQAWVDDIQLEVVGNDVPTTGAPTQPADRVGEPVQGLPEDPKNPDFEG